ncbi:MAG: TIGR03085 family metal-binding protein [Actinomycetota bacterium]|nr:TIGR03085 family metal-binding protein [Actinomycetota bacterium]
MTSLARRERAALADLLADTGPDAPTLCGGWTTRDLAAHLLVRERSPAAAGIVVRPLAGWTEWDRKRTARRDYATLVQEVRTGPPRWSALRIPDVDKLVNTVEFFVHHEDVRRAVTGWQPRELDPADDGALWKATRSRASLLLRRSRVGVTLTTPDGRTAPGRPGTPSVTLVGAPGELLVYLHGRTDHALVQVEGDDDAVDAFRETPLAV